MTGRAIIFACLGLLALLIGLWELSGRGSLNPALAPAERAAEEVAATTATVYVSLRVINAALSTAQEVELGASVGAQASLQPLKVLEPVDDTVERVADVVFAVAIGAALATVGFAPIAAIGLVLLGAGGLIHAAGLLWPAVAQGTGRGVRYAMRLGAVLGLVLPMGFAAGVTLGDRVTAPQWQEAMDSLNAVTAEARILIGATEESPDGAAAAEAAPEGLFGRLGAQLQAAGNGVGDAVEAVGRYREAAGILMSEADTLFRASLTIIGIFALRTLVLPILLLWGALAVMRRSVGAG